MANPSALRAAQLVDTAGPGMKKAGERYADPPSLIEMDEVILNGDEVVGMVRMLDARAEHIVVRVKETADSLTHDAVTLPQLAPLLLQQKIFGAQIQYSFGSSRWLDTLVVTSAGFRLVRVQMS